MEIQIQLPRSRGEKRDQELIAFGNGLITIANRIGFKVSSRGWCYVLEGFNLITKAQFDKVENLINELRKRGGLPIDFVAEEEARNFSGVEIPTTEDPIEYMKQFLQDVLDCEWYYTPNWFEGEEYYIQMIVEKIDLKTLFEPVCKEYHIPIATSKGWSSMLQRSEYARRFKEAEEKGLECILLYCGDHDPDGLRISDFLRKNLEDLARIHWNDGTKGYNPSKLTIDRFGLNYDFIEENGLTWIDNLITGSKKNLASPTHKNFYMPYVQNYLKEIGERKCEANALVIVPEKAHNLCRDIINSYLGNEVLLRFEKKRQDIVDIVTEFRERTELDITVKEAIEMIEEEKEE